MSEAPTIKWPGKSGKEYTYWIYPVGTKFKDSPGNYIYAKETKPGYWSPVYIGQTNSLSTRLANHEKESCTKRNGATHIHAHISGGETERLTEEKDLITRWKPPCNDQLV